MHKIGTDIVEVERIRILIDRYHFKFLNKIFTSEEIAYCNTHKDPSIHFAGRFSAKKAVKKALSSKHGNTLFRYNGIKIINNENGRPHIKIKSLPMENIDISISHTSTHAISVAILSDA